MIRKEREVMSFYREIVSKVLDENSKNRIKCFFSFRYYNKFKKYKNKKKIFYMLVPNHGNMGDQAIALATLKYLNDKFNEYEIIEVYREDTCKYSHAIKRVINDDDIIVLHGGGNMGNLYRIEEKDRRFIIDKFSNYKIISMTQTISFTKDQEGNEELSKSKSIYNKHKDLTLIAREKISYDTMKREFDIKKVVINPDIVLYLNTEFKCQNNKRRNIMTCLRNDKESILGKQKEEFILKLQKGYENVFNYDTVIQKNLSGGDRIIELKKMFDKFLSSKIVITDRLHGMVFAAITKTPCIVTKSLDHKVPGTYEWLKELNYIKLVDNLEFEHIKPLIDELIELKEFIEIDFNTQYFDKLKDKIM